MLCQKNVKKIMNASDKRLVALQYVSVLITALTSTGYGALLTWTSPALPYLTSTKAEVPLLTKQFDSISSLATVGCFLGFFLNPPFCHQIGTKWTLLLFSLPQIISWLLIVKSESFAVICISRFFGGIGYGGGLCTMTQHITALSNFGNRGLLFSLNNLFMGTGNLLPVLYGSYLSYHQMNVALMIMPIVFFIIFLVLPDSSIFIEMNKKKEEKIKSRAIIDPGAKDGGKNDIQCDTKNDTENCTNDDIKNGIKNDTKYDTKSSDSSKNCSNYNTKNNTKDSTKNGPETATRNSINTITKNGMDNDTETSTVIDTKINIKHVRKSGTIVNIKDGTQESTKSGTKNTKSDLIGTEIGKNIYINESGTRNCVSSTNSTKITHFSIKIFSSKKSKSASVSESRKRNFREMKIWKLMTVANNRKALMIMTCLSGMDIFGGNVPVSSYTQQFLTHRESIMAPEKAALVLSIIRLLAIFISIHIVERIGRRNLLLWTGIVGSVSMGLAGLFFFLKSRKYDITSIGWFPVVWITIAEASNAVGVGNTFFALQGELFANDVQSFGISITNIIYMILAFLAMIKFQELLHSLGMYTILWFFSICFGALPLIIYFIAPETKGKSLDQIQEDMKVKR